MGTEACSQARHGGAPGRSCGVQRGARHARARRASPTSQRGAVAIIVGLSLALLIGMVGLAIDGGRLYLTKTELQNAADACALAASYELTGAPTIAPEAFDRAVLVGKAVGSRNKVLFQQQNIAQGEIAVSFGTALNGGAWVGTPAPANSRYVRCVVTRQNIPYYFMPAFNSAFATGTVNALATATLSPAQTNCAVPMALCTRGAAPSYGYVAGDWVSMDFGEQGGGGTPTASYTGNFRWIDFFPDAVSPGCSGGGAQELACLLRGTGQCSLPGPTLAACTSSGNANPTPGCVGQTGAINSLDKAYNTRFGVYAPGAGGGDVTTAPPDFSGYAYSTENWVLGRSAYDGVSGALPNYKAARAARTPIQANPNITDPKLYANNDTIATQAQYSANGADRRLVVMPIVDCGSFTGTQHAPVRAYACVLMLDPYRKAPGNNVVSRLEYLGRSNEAGSPCATSGIAGNSASQGPMVPALVQ